MMEDALILLRFNCPDGDGGCDYIASGWSDLKLHVKGHMETLRGMNAFPL